MSKELKSATQEEQENPKAQERADTRDKEQDSKIRGRDAWRKMGLHRMNKDSKVSMKGTKPKGSKCRDGISPSKGELVKAHSIRDYFQFRITHTDRERAKTTKDSQGNLRDEPGPQTKKS